MLGLSVTAMAWVLAVLSGLMGTLAVVAYVFDMRRGLRGEAVSGACVFLLFALWGAFLLGVLLLWLWLIEAALGATALLLVVGTWAERRVRRQERGRR